LNIHGIFFFFMPLFKMYRVGTRAEV
jgi:hypothetical protein